LVKKGLNPQYPLLWGILGIFCWEVEATSQTMELGMNLVREIWKENWSGVLIVSWNKNKI
jgi:hypothetical protein